MRARPAVTNPAVPGPAGGRHLRRPARRCGRLWAALALLAVLTGTLASGCSSSAAERPERSGSGGVTITLYNGQHVQTTDALMKAFESTTGIRVAVRSDDEDALADAVASEGSRSPADVIFTENSPALQFLAGKGLLARLPASILSRTPSRFDSPRGQWVGVSARVSVLVYNPSLIKASELPGSILQLADPRYRGKLAIAPGETDFQPIVTAVQRRYGTARTLRWLDGLKANAGSHVYPDNESITNAVNRGQVALGVINQYYWYRLGAEIGRSNLHSRIAELSPRDPGYVIDVSGAAVLASSKHRRQADELVQFLVSKKGQEIIAHSDSFEYPIASGVTTAEPETPFADLRPDPITVSDLGDGSLAVSLLQRAGLL